MKILITICGRGGSKGIIGKNIRKLNGIPLIGYSIKTAKQFLQFHPESDIALSTDSKDIKAIAETFNIYSDYIRPEHLATDEAGKMGVIRDVLFYYENKQQKIYDYVLDLDITSPLRTIEDLTRSLSILEHDKRASNLFSVSLANRNPYFNIVEKKANGYYGVVKSLENNFLTRQSAPKVYDMNASFYFYRRRFFNENLKSCITPYSKIYEVPHLCFDLDHMIDFEFMEFLLAHNKLDFAI